eukprot:m.92913 g.92913  ORF g.92913 m.92913 type:complete len:81 (-) comp26582_c0_seq1:41-283(-)
MNERTNEEAKQPATKQPTTINRQTNKQVKRMEDTPNTRTHASPYTHLRAHYSIVFDCVCSLTTEHYFAKKLPHLPLIFFD